MGLIPTLLNMKARNYRSRAARAAFQKALGAKAQAEQDRMYRQEAEYLSDEMRRNTPLTAAPNIWQQSNPFMQQPKFRDQLLD